LVLNPGSTSANVGSRLLTAQAVHVAAVLPNLQYASELAEFERLRDDPYEGLTIVDGEILVPDEIGSGVRRRS
jgi:L-alanine-DL-glutamate epimerase-like enolase superfamily enzyme